MPLKFAKLQQEFDKNRVWMDEALALINKFLNDDRFYANQMSKTFLKQYNSHDFEKRKDFMKDIKQLEIELTNRMQELEEQQASLLKKFKRASNEDLPTIRDKYVKCDDELNYIKMLLQREVKGDMIKLNTEQAHLTDAQIMNHVHHYSSADCERSPLGKLAAITEKYYMTYLKEKAESSNILTEQEKILSEALNTVASINSCAGTAARAVRVTPNMENEVEERKECIEKCLILTKSCLQDLMKLAELMNAEITKYYKMHPETLKLERLKDKEGGLANPAIELMNLVNEQTDKLSYFQDQLKELNNKPAVAIAKQLTQSDEHKAILAV